MQLFHFYHHHHSIQNLLKSDFWLFELSIWLHVIARSLITIFIPVLLLTHGFSLSLVMVYYFVFCLIDVPLNFLAGSFIKRIGARWVIVISNLFIITYFIGFGFLSGGENILLLMILAVLAALYDAFYWTAHLYLFIKSNSDQQKTGGNTGILYSVKRVGTMIGPLAGALILTFSQDTVLIGVSITIFFLSIIPLLYVDEFPDKPTPEDKFTPFSEFFKNPVEKNNFISYGLFSIHRFAELILWPLFIFLIFESINSVAIVPVLIAGTTIIFSLFTRRVNSSLREKMIMIGAISIALIWFFRLFTHWEAFYYISIVLVSIFALFVNIPLDSHLFIRAKSATDPLKTAVFRNAVSMGSRLIVFVGIAIATNVFQVSFAITVAALLLMVVVNYYFLTADKEEFDSIIG